MKKLTICLDLLLIFGGNLCAQEFQLITPDTDKIQQQLIDSDYQEEAIYYYLINNFKQVSGFYETKSFAWDTEALCSYAQDFEEGIRYTINECGESGADLKITFPKVKREKIMTWIEQIHSVYESENDTNVWSDDHTTYQPSEMLPGCYYEIQETNYTTSVTIYCGC